MSTDLTPRELEILTLVAEGATRAQTAERLQISEATVRTHMSRVLLKLDAHTQAHAVAVLMSRGLIKPEAARRTVWGIHVEVFRRKDMKKIFEFTQSVPGLQPIVLDSDDALLITGKEYIL